ncbi:MAG: hypothetical protein WBN75_02720 [Verrucomicrobiia bacterium]
MPESDDITRLRQYVEGDESAFAVLVERYVHLVYSTALRQVGKDKTGRPDIDAFEAMMMREDCVKGSEQIIYNGFPTVFMLASNGLDRCCFLGFWA